MFDRKTIRMTAVIFKVWVIALVCSALISADEDRTRHASTVSKCQ